MRLKNTFIAVGLIIILTSCSSVPMRDGQYDYSAFLVDSRRMDLSRIVNSVRQIVTETRFIGEGGEIIRSLTFGTGLILPDNRVLTVAHVVMVNKLTQQLLTPFGVITLVVSEQRAGSETFMVEPEGQKIPLSPLLISDEDDVAIMSLPMGTKLESAFPYNIGNSDDLRIGNMVYVVGRPLDQDVNVREGIISGLRGNALTKEIYANPDNLFMFSSGIMSGDSGSPIIAIRDGVYEIVGMANGVVARESRLGCAIRINRVKELLQSVEMRAASKAS
jgi:S1-C subfamily serine protease